MISKMMQSIVSKVGPKQGMYVAGHQRTRAKPNMVVKMAVVRGMCWHNLHASTGIRRDMSRNPTTETTMTQKRVHAGDISSMVVPDIDPHSGKMIMHGLRTQVNNMVRGHVGVRAGRRGGANTAGW